jgi:carbamate kinase
MDRVVEGVGSRVRPLLVVAIGGNALVGADGRVDVPTQRANARRAAAQLARLADANDLVITHGNGPQVGVLAMQAAADPTVVAPPLDVLDAESVGLVGYLLVESLSRHVEPSRVVCVLTRVEVDGDDPAFGRPTKPVGPWFAPGRAGQLAATHGWDFVEGPLGARRIVASPEPRRIVELGAIAMLARAGNLVVAGGGGGIPVITRDGVLVGTEAVVDKDLTAALLAVALGADRLIVLTDVDAVYADYGLPAARALGEVTPDVLRTMSFPVGSMGPKIDAVCRFVEQTGGQAAVGSLAEAEAVLAGGAGTRIVASH